MSFAVSKRKLSPFAELTRKLRGSEKRRDLAERFFIAEGTISNLESGRAQRSQSYLEALEQEYAKNKAVLEELKEAFDCSPPSPKIQRPANTKLEREIRALFAKGNISEAVETTLAGLEGTSDKRELAGLCEIFAEIAFSINGLEDEGLDMLTEAIALWWQSGLDGKALSALRDQLAARHQHREEYGPAHLVLDEGLFHDPTASLLWYRKGIVHWYQHAYDKAYASLMTALTYKHDRSGIIEARGGVLAEWGRYDEALSDLNEFLEMDGPIPSRKARARSTKAYVMAKLWDMEGALKEFGEAEKITPDDAWLYYYRGVCRFNTRNTAEWYAATEDLERALTCQNPRLNLPKRVRAQDIITFLTPPEFGEEGNSLFFPKKDKNDIVPTVTIRHSL